MAIRVVATGDVMPVRPPAQGAGTAQVFALLQAADVTFTNLETPLSRRGTPADKVINFRSAPELATHLAAAGIDVATVANNHALDYGAEALLDTLEVLRAAGVAPTGGGADLAASLQPAIVERGGKRIAIFGMACTLPTGYAAGHGRPGITPIKVYSKFVVDPMTMDEQPGTAPHVETSAAPEDVQRAVEAIGRAKQSCDHVLVGIHWGVAYGWVAMHQDYMAHYQQPLGHALIDAGADALFGHHPHVVHGIEVYRGRPIFYSLGNLLFHATARSGEGHELTRFYPPYDFASLGSETTRESFLVNMSLPGSEIELVPTVMNAQGEPVFPDPQRATAILQRVAGFSARFGTRLAIEGGRGLLTL